MLSERAEDPDYIVKRGLKIDSKYYLENQILPPLERVFEAVGVDRTEIVGIGKQTLLTHMFSLNGNGKTSNAKIEPLLSADGLICNSCSRTYSVVPILGKCTTCSGELHFYTGETKSKYLII